MPIKPIEPMVPRIQPIGAEQEEPTKLTTTTPPEPTEYFPGFASMTSELAKKVYQANKTSESAFKTLSQVKSKGVDNLWKRLGRSILGGVLPPLGILSNLTAGYANEEEYTKALTAAQEELDISTRELQNAEWQLQVLNSLPAMLASRKYSIKSIDDILAAVPNSLATDSERQWLQGVYDQLKYLSNALPEGFDGTVEESQQKILEQILKEPNLPLRSVVNLTVEELERTLQPLNAELPEGLSADDVRSILSQTQLEDETSQKQLSAYLLGLASDWAKETDRMNLLRAGLLQAESPELTPLEFAKLMFVQPLMGGIELLNKYFDLLPRPLASAAVIGVHNLFKTPDDTLAGRMHEAYQYYRGMGESAWSAYTLAINETDMPWYMRLLEESAFDPTTYLGLGLATSVATKTGSLLTRIGLRSVGSRIGPLVGAVENGYVKGADAVFRAGVEVVLSPIKGSSWLAGAGYRIPKTLTMMSRNFARSASMNFKSVLDRMYPEVRNLQGLTARDIREAAQGSIDAALSRPDEGLDLMVKTGTELLEFDYLDSAAAAKLLKGATAKELELDTATLARLNDEVLNMFSGQPAKTTAGKILSVVGEGQSDEAVSALVSRLSTFKDDAVESAMRVFKSESPSDQLIGMFTRLEETRYNNLKNPIMTHMTQAGQTVSWVSRVADRVLYATNLVKLERAVVMPFARWNLLFANFGPMNFLENMQRSFLGGAEVMYPKSYGGVAETNRLFRGLTNAPYELQMAERGQQRMEMALVDPKTGSTTAFRGGKIPFVTRPVSIRGKELGKTINIRGVDYKLTDMQSYNDMWEQMTTIQRAYDYQVHYMKALPEVAPDEMRQIVQAVTNHHSKLEQIGRFSKSDIKDIERTIIQDATVGPEAVATHSAMDALELERRQISKELGKVFDKATEVRSATKLGIRNEVLDGSIFKDIDGRIAAYVEAERELNLASLAPQMDALAREADDFAKIYGGKASLLDDLSQDLVVDVSGYKGTGVLDIKLNGESVGTINVTNLGDTLQVNSLTITKPGTLNRRLVQDLELNLHELARSQKLAKVSIAQKPQHKSLYELAGYKSSPLGYTKDVMQPPGIPQNIDELLGDLENISAIQNGVDERIHDYRRLAELRSQKLKPGKEVDDFHVGTNKLLGEFMEQSQESMDKIIANLKDFLKLRQGVKLSDSQVKAVDALADLYRLENANVLATRNRLAEVESAISKTSPKSRDARFWQQQRAAKSGIWDEHTVNARRLRNLRLDASRVFLNSVKKGAFVPDTIPEVTGKLTPSHVAYLFGVTGDDVYRGLTRVHTQVTIRPKEDFIDYVRNQANAYAAKFEKTAAGIGFTDEAIGDVYDQLWGNLGINPSILAPDSPTLLQLEDIRQELNRLHAGVKMDETDVAKWKGYVDGVSSDLRDTTMYKGGKTAPEWYSKKESAMAEARKQHELAYPTYDDANIIDETMRAIFPFWTYEAFRWRWIPRTFMRTPGTMTTIARYMDYTDGGYIPVPGTDLQINPLRGSIWMGGMRRFFLKDFPEYYDAFPGMEFIDYISRAGFYPGIQVMAPVVIFGAATGKPELSEIAPTWMKSGLSALRALSPEHIGKILDVVYPDRFRDFQTMLTLGEQGYDADELWRKRESGEKLTEEEEKLWLRAEAKANGLKGILMEQTGLFRIRPEEYDQLRTEMRLAIQDATGVPVRVQEQIDRLYPTTGKRFSDYYSLDVLQQKLLYESEAYRRWQGVATPLYPAGWQALEIKIKDYYDTLEKNSHDARYVGVYDSDTGELVRPSMAEVNRQFVEGTIGPDQWKSMRSEIQSSLAESARALAESPAYKGVPKTLEERTAWLAEKGVPAPTLGPSQELLDYYYELEPEMKYNWDSDRMELDFDTYYAQVDILLDSLDEAHRQRLLDRIQLDWTPMEKLYWTVSREYFRAYRNIRTIVMAQYSDEEKKQIRRFEVARGSEREALQDIEGPEGDKLISGFNSKVREARQRLRYVDPTLDAWSYFFGNTDSFLTDDAKAQYSELVKQYMTSEMVQ